MIKNVLPLIPVPNNERQQEQGPGLRSVDRKSSSFAKQNQTFGSVVQFSAEGNPQTIFKLSFGGLCD